MKLRYPFLIIILLLLVLIAIGSYLLTQRQTETWSVSLTTDWSSVGTGSAVHLTATANHPVDGTPYFISIKDANTGAQVIACQQGTVCVGTVTRDQAMSESFVAAVGNQAQSATVPVAWRDWQVRITADTSHVQAGDRVTLTAHANQDVDFARYGLAIVDQSTGNMVKDCAASTTCMAVVTRANSTRERFVAQVTDHGVLAATSAPQVVLWDFSWQVTLKADRPLVGTGSPVTLTATANHRVDGSPYTIRIEEARSGTMVATCRQGSTCAATVTQNQAASEQFVAVIGDQARSAGVPVTWQAWSIQLTATQTRVNPGVSVTLSAHIGNSATSSPFALSIVDSHTSQVAKDCGRATTCAVQVSQAGDQSQSFVARVKIGNAYTTDSQPVTVIWGHPVVIVPQNGGVTVQLLDVAFVDPLHGWAVGDNGTIVHTTNGGATWLPQSSGTLDALLSVAFADAHTGWAVGSSGTILHTTDGGASWLPQQSGIPDPLKSVTFINATTGWVLSVLGTILHTTDGGATWSTQYSSTTTYLTSMTFVDARNGWAVGPAGTILHTSNGGATWLPQNSRSSAGLSDVTFSNARSGWVVGSRVGSRGTILHTSNGGTTWSAQQSGTLEDLTSVWFTDPRSGWVVGYGGTILRTTDGGVTWLPRNSGTSEYLSSVAFAGASNGWAVGATLQANGVPSRGPILHISVL